MELPSYVELHCVTHFTFLRGASHPEELVERAHELGYAALAITDECSVGGVVRAHTTAKERGLQLLIGAEFRLTCGLKCVAIAPDRPAYGQLCRTITRGRRAAEKGHYHLGRADLESGLAGCLLLLLPEGEPGGCATQWLEQARWFSDAFRDRGWLAVELLRDGLDRERLQVLEQIALHCTLPLVASGNVHLHHRARRRLQDALTAVRLGVSLQEAGWRLEPNGERYLRERARLAKLYPPALLAATLHVAERCQFSLDELRYEYPREIVPEGQTPTSWLRHLTEEGALRRWPGGPDAHIRSLIEHELALIRELAYEPYFLTVQDIVAFAKSRGILCQGRGSAANSVVCFCLDVTEVDPARLATLFERFISKERNEPPDIDIDFEHERREEVIQYVYAKYGRERAALAATVITYRPRSALRDLGKALGLEPAQTEKLARGMQWWDGSRIDPERVREAGFDPDNPLLARLLQLCGELMGFPRHLSQHVGGFVISAGPLEELVPIENASMPDRTVIQWDKNDLDDLGLIKVDLLGLGMLTAIRRALALVADYRGMPFTLASIPPEDPLVYEMASRGDTVGVFQIESRAQMSMLPRLKPRCFYDLVIEVAIVRPGPIQGDMVHPYLRRRMGEESVSYPSKEVESVLKRTLGVPIFQEQVMQLAIVAAGFTPGEADRLRRAMAAWKRRGGLAHFEQRLTKGMLDRNYTEAFAHQIFQQILGFGEYGFPECVVGETRVVDADSGRWVRIDDLVAGRARLTHTLACDAQLRLQRRQVVGAVASGIKPVWRLRTALGYSVAASAEHPLLTPNGWQRLEKLRPGDYVAAARSVTAREIHWDEITSIDPAGERPTYDLQVEGDHNFLADNLVVHNSHAASFALLVYSSAWLKCHEPAAFTCALLNSLPMGFYAPAQLVRDARVHGVEVRPVDVRASGWDCVLERLDDGTPALRLGFTMARSLARTAVERLVAARAEHEFQDVQDLTERALLERGDLEALAAAGALAGLTGNRHLAFWEVAGTERPLPLAPAVTAAAEGRPLLAAPTEGEDIVADYRALGLTLGRHPVALLRPQLAAEHILSAAELAAVASGRRVKIAGIVTIRQRPGSAGGVTFVTLEDETGVVNLIVWKTVAEAQRRPLLESRLLEVEGKLQREGLVTHVVATRLTDRSPLLGQLLARSRDFH